MEQVPLRNVATREIYESYMGILRISPNIVGTQIDDPSLLFVNPKDEDGDRRIPITDSDGTKLGADFIPKIRTTEVIDGNGNKVTKDVVNLTLDTKNCLFSSQSFNIRSTLIVNDENQNDKIMPIQVYQQIGNTCNVISYPLESPHDGGYFNTGNKLGLIDYSNRSKPIRQQLIDNLKNKSNDWYSSNISAENRVKINDSFVFTQNENQESIPIVYTKDYVLGTYKGHTAKINKNVRNDFLGEHEENDKLQDNVSNYTRLDFIELDRLVWSYLNEILAGETRDTEGRYTELGLGQNRNIKGELFGDEHKDVSKKAPLLGGGVASGTISYSAMPFHRYAFHLLRQELRNKVDDGSLSNEFIQHINDKKITPVNKKQSGFVSTLTKDYVLCDGKEINYVNYPSMNTENTTLFSFDAKGNVNRNNGIPVLNTSWEDNRGHAFNAIKQSYSDREGNKGKFFKTPNLIANDIGSMRYIRGLNWVEKSNKGVILPIDHDNDVLTYTANTNKIEIVNDSEWGSTIRDISLVGNYRTCIDFRLRKTRHFHYLFYDSKTENRTANGNNITDDGDFGYSIVGTQIEKTEPFDYGDSIAYRPFFWNSDANSNTKSYKTNSEVGESESLSSSLDGVAQVRYSFKKRQTYINDEGKLVRRPNNFSGHTPIPAGALIAWKLDGVTGKMNNGEARTQSDLADGLYMQDISETQINTDEDTRRGQLYFMNMVEGYFPVATKGGTDQAKTFTRVVYTVRNDDGSLRDDQGRYRNPFSSNTGGYAVKKYSDTIVSDIPRCVTSLLIPDKLEDIDSTPGVEGEENRLSQPPSINLIPLFKL